MIANTCRLLLQELYFKTQENVKKMAPKIITLSHCPKIRHGIPSCGHSDRWRHQPAFDTAVLPISSVATFCVAFCWFFLCHCVWPGSPGSSGCALEGRLAVNWWRAYAHVPGCGTSPSQSLMAVDASCILCFGPHVPSRCLRVFSEFEYLITKDSQ